MTIEKLKTIPQGIINRVRNYPIESGLAFQKFGKYSDIKQYSDREITEMIYGLYTDKQMILVDGDYFVDLNDVIETICVLDKAAYHKEPTKEDFKTNLQNTVRNIRTFYVKDYILVTKIEVGGTTRHKITNLLYKIGAIREGQNKFIGLFSISNDYKTLHSFTQGLFPKVLYHPIKRYINGLFFQDDYHISNFNVESNFKIEK
jgi:hypothetical protein